MTPPFTRALPVRLLQTQTDARLLELAARGQERAFEALVHRHRRPLLRYARRLLLPEAQAEDAVQQACLSAWLALQRGVVVMDARAWLYRIVHNAALSALRRSGYDHAELSETLCGGDAPQADLDRRIAVRRALAGVAALPDLQREALLRTAIEGHSHERVAGDLGLSEGAVRGLVYRARATLRATAAALLPPPLVGWLAAGHRVRSPLAERIAEGLAGAGAAGLAGAALKGGAVVASVGALATGVGLVPPVSLSATAKAAPAVSTVASPPPGSVRAPAGAALAAAGSPRAATSPSLTAGSRSRPAGAVAGTPAQPPAPAALSRGGEGVPLSAGDPPSGQAAEGGGDGAGSRGGPAAPPASGEDGSPARLDQGGGRPGGAGPSDGRDPRGSAQPAASGSGAQPQGARTGSGGSGSPGGSAPSPGGGESGASVSANGGSEDGAPGAGGSGPSSPAGSGGAPSGSGSGARGTADASGSPTGSGSPSGSGSGSGSGA